MVKAQMKIQQMAIMILAVFLFFILAGLFFLSIQTKGMFQNYESFQIDKAITSLKVIFSSTEFNCEAFSKMPPCLDEDKLVAMTEMSDLYEGFWGVSSIEVYKVYPAFSKQVGCPAPNCNYYRIYDDGKNKTKYSTFVSICDRKKYSSSPFVDCEVGMLVVGVKS